MQERAQAAAVDSISFVRETLSSGWLSAKRGAGQRPAQIEHPVRALKVRQQRGFLDVHHQIGEPPHLGVVQAAQEVVSRTRVGAGCSRRGRYTFDLKSLARGSGLFFHETFITLHLFQNDGFPST